MSFIANRQATPEEIEAVKMAGTIQEAGRRIVNAGGFPLLQMAIDDPAYLVSLLEFHSSYVPTALNYAALLKWFQENKLEKFLPGRSLEKSIKQQEAFYQKVYGKSFHIDRKKISVDARRLPAIKAGLEAGCLNYAMLKVTPDTLSEVEAQMTEAEFFFERLMKPLKKEGFKIWAETGTDRWTNLELVELLRRCSDPEPEDLDAEAFMKDWVKETIRVIDKVPASKVVAGLCELIFTSNMVDIPGNQIIINKKGENVVPTDRSYISANTKNVRVLSQAEGIILACQMFINDKTYLAPNTWEWRRSLVYHRDKNDNSPVSVASAYSFVSELYLDSYDADDSGSGSRLRLSL